MKIRIPAPSGRLAAALAALVERDTEPLLHAPRARLLADVDLEPAEQAPDNELLMGREHERRAGRRQDVVAAATSSSTSVSSGRHRQSGKKSMAICASAGCQIRPFAFCAFRSCEMPLTREPHQPGGHNAQRDHVAGVAGDGIGPPHALLGWVVPVQRVRRRLWRHVNPRARARRHPELDEQRPHLRHRVMRDLHVGRDHGELPRRRMLDHQPELADLLRRAFPGGPGFTVGGQGVGIGFRQHAEVAQDGREPAPFLFRFLVHPGGRDADRG